MAHVLVTGGCGFFGAWILRRLLVDGHDATVWDIERNEARWHFAMIAREIERIRFQQVRIDDAAAVQKAMADCRPDAVIHLAGIQVPGCKANPVAGATVNVIGMLAIFEAARALKSPPAVAYASSAAVFGSDRDYPGGAGDAAQPKPGTIYGAFKACNELCAKVYWKDYGLRSVGFRPLTVYGPGRDVGMTSFPTRAIAAALLKVPFEIPFSGKTAYTYVEEVAAYFVAAALSPPEGAPAFTVGGAIADTAAFIAELERQVPGAAERIRITGGDLPIAANLVDTELRTAFPEIPRISLKDGMARTIDVFRKRQADGTLEV
ncbi:MAG: NAD(P)-dependent oxidoreductase [Planctomycetes bacterium]|nr:NAD(P)-dependent oxidoreductase [Planctomycetota bacterium]